MTETDWLASTDPRALLGWVQPILSDRQRRLLACACSRLLWGSFPAERWRQAVALAERYADGQAHDDEVERLHAQLREEQDDLYDHDAEVARGISGGWRQGLMANLCAAETALERRLTPFALANLFLGIQGCVGADRLCAAIRDIVGNPFRTVFV